MTKHVSRECCMRIWTKWFVSLFTNLFTIFKWLQISEARWEINSRTKKNVLHINCMNTFRVYVCIQFKLKENRQWMWKKAMTKKSDSMNEIVRLNFIWRKHSSALRTVFCIKKITGIKALRIREWCFTMNIWNGFVLDVNINGNIKRHC